MSNTTGHSVCTSDMGMLHALLPSKTKCFGRSLDVLDCGMKLKFSNPKLGLLNFIAFEYWFDNSILNISMHIFVWQYYRVRI